MALNMGGMGKLIRAEKHKPKNGWETLKRLTSYYTKHKLTMFVLVICAAIDVVSSIATPLLIGGALDDCFHVSSRGIPFFDVDFPLLVKYISVLIVLYVFSAICSWWREYGQQKLSLEVTNLLRNELMKKMLSYPVSYFDNHSRGEIMSGFTNDVELINKGIGETLLQMVSAAITMVGMICVMWNKSWQLMLCMACTIPLVIMLSRIIMAKCKSYFSAQQKTVAEMNGIIEEGLNGLKVSRAFLQEEIQINRFEKANKELMKVGVKAQILSGLIMPLLRILDNLSYIVIAVVGGAMALSGAITIGVVQTFLLYSRQFLRPVNMVAMQLNQVQSAIAGAERIFEMMDQAAEPFSDDNKDCVESSRNDMDKTHGKIEFRHVSFSYIEGVPVLQDISFVILPNQFVALVGQTGEGKSTIVNLLLRFYKPQSGEILIDDVNINDMPLAELRRKVGLVLQDAILFSDTVKYNIKYGRPSASDAEMKQAAVLSNADKVIEPLPEKYDTMLSNQGVNISQGERQLCTIARAVLPGAPILIFDEATSNIDVYTEKLVQGAVDNLHHKSTCFIIAHRLSTVQGADNILVLAGGKVAESGTHDALMANEKSIYGEIFRSQF